jgi:hypothetical protein
MMSFSFISAPGHVLAHGRCVEGRQGNKLLTIWVFNERFHPADACSGRCGASPLMLGVRPRSNEPATDARGSRRARPEGGRFQLWVHGRQFSEAHDYDDGNWLRVTAHCGASGASDSG